MEDGSGGRPPPGGPEQRRRYLPLAASLLPSLALASPLPPHLLCPRVLPYDTAVFPFRAAAAAVLGVGEEELASLHKTQEGRQVLEQEKMGAARRRRGKLPPYLRQWAAARGSPEMASFDSILHDFVKTVVAGNMVEEEREEREVAAVAYQREPTFRVVLPSGQPNGYLHCDADYHHPPSEVNWWIPLTPVSGCSSLYTESAPGRGDFAPLTLDYGQAFRFYGNLCQHYAEPNISDTTRVSFDLRVVSLEHHSDEWRDRLGRETVFRVGEYYTRVGEEEPTG